MNALLHFPQPTFMNSFLETGNPPGISHRDRDFQVWRYASNAILKTLHDPMRGPNGVATIHG
jgi:hypothetical protein